MRFIGSIVAAVVGCSSIACGPNAVNTGSIATIVPRTSHRSSSCDRSGGNADSLDSFAPGTAHTMLDVDGPGCVTHLWMTLAVFPGHATFLRDLVLRAWWENSAVPSVEVPLGDFFALGHGKRYPVQSVPVAVGQNPVALNCYWPMPFRRHARIEIANAGERTIRRLYYHVDYELGPIPPDQGLFHAAFHREKRLRTQGHDANTTGAENYVILETTGEGQYVGCVLSVDAQPGGWWGEGDDMIFVDDATKPTIIGTGSEDYFSNAWGYNTAFSYPYYGAPLVEKRADGGSFTTVYRWHIADPIRFRKRIKVTLEHLFGKGTANDYASVAFWYQREPVRQREPLPCGSENHPLHPETQPASPAFDVDSAELEPQLRARGLAVRVVTTFPHEGYKYGGWIQIEAPNGRIDFDVPVPSDGPYQVTLKPVDHLVSGPLTIRAQDGTARTYEKQGKPAHKTPFIDLGRVRPANGAIRITIEGNPVVGIDCVHLEKAEE